MKKPQLKTSIPVTHPCQILIIEKSDTGMDIKKGSHIYCGLCGGTLGRMNHEMKLPVSHETFIEKMNSKLFATTKTERGTAIFHSCKKILFHNTASWTFIGMDEYVRQVEKMDHTPKNSASTGESE